MTNQTQSSPFGRRHFPRDSGCYEGSPLPASQLQQIRRRSGHEDSNNLDSIVEQCSNEILKRVEGSRRFKDDTHGPKTIGRPSKKGLLGGNDDICSRAGALSEKSSDSGVSSSSLSSGPMKNNL
jgi:SAM and SH3 domain-containing protein 1